MKYLLILAILNLLISKVQSRVKEYKVAKSTLKTFSFKEVCQYFGHRHLLLVNMKNINEINCMGTTVKANVFCQKKFANKSNLLRGYVDKQDRLVKCQMGENVILKIACEKKYRNYCQYSFKSCSNLRKFFAVNLNLIHHAVVEDAIEDKFLNCYFSSKSNYFSNDVK